MASKNHWGMSVHWFGLVVSLCLVAHGAFGQVSRPGMSRGPSRVRSWMRRSAASFRRYPADEEGIRYLLEAARESLHDPVHRGACEPLAHLIRLRYSYLFTPYGFTPARLHDFEGLEQELRSFCPQVPRRYLEIGRRRLADFHRTQDVGDLLNSVGEMVQSQIPDASVCEAQTEMETLRPSLLRPRYELVLILFDRCLSSARLLCAAYHVTNVVP